MVEQIVVHCVFLGLLMIPVIILGKLNWRSISKSLVLSIYINLFTYFIISLAEWIINHNVMEVSLLLLDLLTAEGWVLFLIDVMLFILALQSFEYLSKKFFGRKVL